MPMSNSLGERSRIPSPRPNSRTPVKKSRTAVTSISGRDQLLRRPGGASAFGAGSTSLATSLPSPSRRLRSEERRVGKECRTQSAAQHLKADDDTHTHEDAVLDKASR